MPNLTMIIHGESGVGKSYLAATAPAPRLILDAEGGTSWLPGKKVHWDLASGSPPPPTEETCVATVKDFKTLSVAYQRLASGKHPFRSVVIDSLTEVQKRAMDVITGTEAARQADWGELLRKLEGLVRAFRDLTLPNGTPGLTCMVFITGTQMKDGVLRPHLQGQIGLTAPYFVDVVGYLRAESDEGGQLVRKLLVAPIAGFTCKDRTGRLGFEVVNPNLSDMVARLQES